VVRDGKVLLTKRAVDPERGRWDIPGGFLTAGEPLVDGVAREVREELGLEIDVSISDLVQAVPHTYGPEEDWVLAHGFTTTSFSGEPKLVDEIDEILWADAAEVDRLDFAWEHDRELARTALNPDGGDKHGS
jgi:ADP-ribose pyrophosphatase YjhB (NUDIX family)